MQAEQRIDELRKRSMALDLLLILPCDQQCLGSNWGMTVRRTMIQFCSSVSFFEDSPVESRALIG
jgi:hypothetical protein